MQGVWDLRYLIVRVKLRHHSHVTKTLVILDQVSQSCEAPLLKAQDHVTAQNVVPADNSPSSRLEWNSLFLEFDKRIILPCLIFSFHLKYLLNLSHVIAVYVYRRAPSSTGDLIP